MACFLNFSDQDRECSGCARTIRPGLIGYTDEIEPRKLQPVCRNCLDGLVRKLRGVQAIVREAGRKLLE